MDQVVIGVQDNGEGIPPGQLEEVFQRFTPLAHSRGKKGTGIGLAFSRQLAGYLHGSLEARSEGRDRGTLMVLRLPKGRLPFAEEYFAAPSAPGPEAGRPRAKADAGPGPETDQNAKPGLILIIEDEPATLELERLYLEAAGYHRFILARDGKEGLEAAYRHHPDLILCDVLLPQLRGDELHDRLSRDPAFHHTPFLFASAVSEQEIILDLRRRGAGDFLTKPISRKDLVRAVDLQMEGVWERQKALKIARTDALTGLASRKFLMEEIQRRISEQPYSSHAAVLVDLHAFRRVNETFGHEEGDRVLAEAAQRLRAGLGPRDLAGRVGGAEFLVFLPGTGIEAARKQADVLGRRICALPFEVQGGWTEVRAFLGVSEVSSAASGSASTLAEEAERNLRTAKTQEALRKSGEPVPGEGPP